MVSLPDDLVQALDLEARRRSVTRSALLAAAARRELDRKDPQLLAAAIARSEQRFAAAGPFDSRDLVRRERDSHH